MALLKNKLPRLGLLEQLFIELFFGVPGVVMAGFGAVGLRMYYRRTPDVAPNPTFAWAFVIAGAALIALCAALFVRFLRSRGKAGRAGDDTLPADANTGH